MDIKKDLDSLEKAIIRLRMEYDQYFCKSLKKEPLALKEEIERIILKYSSTYIKNTALKFRFNSLTARFNAYKNYWNRILRGMETRIAENHLPEQNKNGISLLDEKRLKALYIEYIEARRRCNQPAEDLSYEKMERAVREHLLSLKNKGIDKKVDIQVFIKDGKARLSIMPKDKASN